MTGLAAALARTRRSSRARGPWMVGAVVACAVAAGFALPAASPATTRDPPPVPAVAAPDPEALEALREGLALADASREPEAQVALRRAVALAADDPELVAEARIALAAIDVSRRQWSGAAQQLEQALAIAPRRDDLVFEALVAWATVDSQRNRLDEASRHLDRAQPVGARLTGDPGHAGAVLLGRAQVAHAGHRPEATLELATEAARGLERAAGGQPKRLATAWRLIAAARVDLAQSDEALEACRMCTRTIESAYGASHPEVSQCLLCEGMALESLGRYDETMARLQRAVALTQPLGADNPRRALLLAYQGRIAESRGHVDAAVELHARAVEAASRTERPDPWLLGATLDNLARAHAAAGDRDTAATMFARALTNLEASHGTEDPIVAGVRVNYCIVLIERGDLDEARRELELALPILRKHHGAGGPLTALARIDIAQGRPDRAWPRVDELLEVAADPRVQPRDAALARYWAAAVARTNPSLPRAHVHALARAARAALESVHPTLDPDLIADLRTWIDSRAAD